MYETLDEIWLYHAALIMLEGKFRDSRDGGSKELIGINFCLENPKANFMFNPARKMSPTYAAAELLWYLSGTNEIEMIKHYAPQYSRFSDDGRTANGAYGYRWKMDHQWTTNLFKLTAENRIPLDIQEFFDKHNKCITPITQLQGALWMLKDNPNSRQAIVSMWNAGDLANSIAKTTKDTPCTIALHFIISEGKLHLNTFMRSQDLWMGLPYDVWCFTCIQILAAEALELEVGKYYHNVTSLHIYERHYEKVQAALECEFNTGVMEYSKHNMRIGEAIKYAVSMEEYIRKEGVLLNEAGERLRQRSLLHQCLAMIAKDSKEIPNKIMKEYVNANFGRK